MTIISLSNPRYGQGVFNASEEHPQATVENYDAEAASIHINNTLVVADQMRSRGAAPSGIRNAFDPVGAILRRAVEREKLASNPGAGLSLPGGDSTPRDRVADPAEAEALIGAFGEPRDRGF